MIEFASRTDTPITTTCADPELQELLVLDPTSGDIYRLTGSRAAIARRLLETDAGRNDVASHAGGEPTWVEFACSSSPGAHPADGPAIAPTPDPGAPVLGERESAILRLVAAGHSNETIAHMLHYSVATVRRTTTAIYRRLGARNRASAIARAHELHLLT